MMKSPAERGPIPLNQSKISCHLSENAAYAVTFATGGSVGEMAISKQEGEEV
jgi:hypothetical protein